MHGKTKDNQSYNNNSQFLKLTSQIRNIFEGKSLFTGQDPEFQTYRSRAHLAEMIRLLGPPPSSLLARGNLTGKFFSKEGKLLP